STSRLPTCAGAGAPSQPSTAPNSHSRNGVGPSPIRYATYWARSIAAVPSAPAARPRKRAASGVMQGPTATTCSHTPDRRQVPPAQAARAPSIRSTSVRRLNGVFDLEARGVRDASSTVRLITRVPAPYLGSGAFHARVGALGAIALGAFVLLGLRLWS